jgi:hypothetical protein
MYRRLYLHLFGDYLVRLHPDHHRSVLTGMVETNRIHKTRVERPGVPTARAPVSDIDASHWHGSFFIVNAMNWRYMPVANALRTSN